MQSRVRSGNDDAFRFYALKSISSKVKIPSKHFNLLMDFLSQLIAEKKTKTK